MQTLWVCLALVDHNNGGFRLQPPNNGYQLQKNTDPCALSQSFPCFTSQLLHQATLRVNRLVHSPTPQLPREKAGPELLEMEKPDSLRSLEANSAADVLKTWLLSTPLLNNFDLLGGSGNPA